MGWLDIIQVVRGIMAADGQGRRNFVCTRAQRNTHGAVDLYRLISWADSWWGVLSAQKDRVALLQNDPIAQIYQTKPLPLLALAGAILDSNRAGSSSLAQLGCRRF